MSAEARENGCEELRREIEALPREFCAGDPPVAVVRRAAVLAIVDRLAAARGEPPEPGPAIDVERLARAMEQVHKNIANDLTRRWPPYWATFDAEASEIAAEYDRLRP